MLIEQAVSKRHLSESQWFWSIVVSSKLPAEAVRTVLGGKHNLESVYGMVVELFTWAHAEKSMQT